MDRSGTNRRYGRPPSTSRPSNCMSSADESLCFSVNPESEQSFTGDAQDFGTESAFAITAAESDFGYDWRISPRVEDETVAQNPSASSNAYAPSNSFEFPQPIPDRSAYNIESQNYNYEEHQALLAQNHAAIDAKLHQFAQYRGTGLAAAAANEEMYERLALQNNEGPLLLPKCIRDVQGHDSAKLQRQHAGHFWIFNPPTGIYRSADLASAIGFTGSLYEKWTPKMQKYWDQRVQELNQHGQRGPWPKG